MGTLDDLFRRFEHLNDIGASLSNERDLGRLLEKIVVAAKLITRADGGTLYLLSEDKRHLHFEIVRTDSLNIAFGGTSGNPVSGKFPDLPLYRDDGTPNDTMIAAYAAISGQTVNIADAYLAKGFDFSGTRKFDERNGYRSQSFLTVPMRDHEGEVIGVLQLMCTNEIFGAGLMRYFGIWREKVVLGGTECEIYLRRAKIRNGPKSARCLWRETAF